MQRAGFQKARARLLDAFKAHEELKSVQDWAAFESAWTRLLTSLNSVYSILEQSVKGSKASERWFAEAKRARKTDEALKYLHHARNANDHGIVEVLRRVPGGLGITSRSGKTYIKELSVGPDGVVKLEGSDFDGSPLIVTSYPESVELVPVLDRGVRYDPPDALLGKSLTDRSPVALASAVLEHMTVLFVDAETLLNSGH
ncbi:MAG: hypothetical protein ABIT69_03790 [Sphingomicrobium sp.]